VRSREDGEPDEGGDARGRNAAVAGGNPGGDTNGHEGNEPRNALTGGTAETVPHGEQTLEVQTGTVASADGAGKGKRGRAPETVARSEWGETLVDRKPHERSRAKQTDRGWTGRNR
jgi:hypothetical protein